MYVQNEICHLDLNTSINYFNPCVNLPKVGKTEIGCQSGLPKVGKMIKLNKLKKNN